MVTRLILFLLSVILLSCGADNSQMPAGVDTVPNNELIFIRLNGTFAIIVNTQTDSVLAYDYVEPRLTQDTMINDELFRDYELSRTNAVKSAELSDSLSILTHTILEDTAAVYESVTDYAGDYFSVKIKKGEVTYSAEFNSVPDWERCTSGTRALNGFLKRNNLIK